MAGLGFLGGILASLLGGFAFAMTRGSAAITAPSLATAAIGRSDPLTLHSVTMMILVLSPSIPATIGQWGLPRFLGVSQLAFPRLAWASLAGYWVGCLVLAGALTFGGLPAGNTLTDVWARQAGAGATIYMFGTALVALSQAAVAANLIATVAASRRAAALERREHGPFVWSLLIASFIQVLAVPPIALGAALCCLERACSLGLFSASLGGDLRLLDSLFWIGFHPLVGASLITAMGLVTEVIGGQTSREIGGRRLLIACMGTLAVARFLGWASHLATTPSSVFVPTMAFLAERVALVAMAIPAFGWVAALTRGRAPWRASTVFAAAFVAIWTLGVLGQLLLPIPDFGYGIGETQLGRVTFHYLVVGGVFAALASGLHEVRPELAAWKPSRRIGSVACCSWMLGLHAIIVVELVRGAAAARWLPEGSWGDRFARSHTAAWLSVGGGACVSLAALLIAYNWWRGVRLAAKTSSLARGGVAEATNHSGSEVRS